MKQFFRALAIFVLVLSYCLEAVSLYSYSSHNNDSFQTKESVVSSVSLNLLGSATNAENIFNVINNVIPISGKDFFKSHTLKIRTKQQIFANQFIQYQFSSKNFQTLFRKTDLIFPFNYFW